MALTDKSILNRGATALPHLEAGFPLLLNTAVNGNRLIQVRTDNKGEVATAGSMTVVGVNASEFTVAAGTYATVNALGPALVIADAAVVAGKPLKAATGGSVVQFVDAELAGDTILTTGNGIGFTNQPANDGVEIVSNNAADTSQSVTIIGTTNATDTVVVETVALNGTTPVSTVKTDWGIILAVKLSASCAGTITVREASADAAITTLLTTVLTKGVETVTTTQAYNVAPTVVGSGAGTKQVGLQGTNSAGTTIYDSQALAGTTAQTMNSAFRTVTEVYTGDVGSSTTVTVAVGAAESETLRIGKSLTAAAAQNSALYALIYP
jgi:hypothetical protein